MRKYLLITLAFFCYTNTFADSILPTHVEIIAVKKQPWQPSIQVTGVILSSKNAKISSEISGRIIKKNFQDGSIVKKGDILYILSSDTLKAQLQHDQANLKLSKSLYSRKKELIKINAISAAEIDAAKTAWQTDEAKVAQAKVSLEHTLIRAPFGGKVGFSSVNIGDYISPGQVLVSLQSLDPMSLQLSIPEIYSNKIKAGQPVSVWSDVENIQHFQGKISELDIEINQKNQSIIAKANILNPNYTLMPGSFINANIFLEEKKPVLIIPQACIQYDKQGPYVYKIIDGKSHKNTINTGSQWNNQIIVISGLNENDEIVSEGQHKLVEGSTVIISKQAEKQIS